MQIQKSPAPVAPAKLPARSETEKAEAPNTENLDSVKLSSAFRPQRDLTYAVGASLAQVPHAINNIAGRSYGIPHAAGAALGGLMAAAGIKEMMNEETAHGRINGAIHTLVGLATAAGPWAGPLSTPIYLTSMATLALKATADRPGTILKMAGSEAVQMTKEVFSSRPKAETEPTKGAEA